MNLNNHIEETIGKLKSLLITLPTCNICGRHWETILPDGFCTMCSHAVDHNND